jgi:Zn-dependent M32 family carboxypeptidase
MNWLTRCAEDSGQVGRLSVQALFARLDASKIPLLQKLSSPAPDQAGRKRRILSSKVSIERVRQLIQDVMAIRGFDRPDGYFDVFMHVASGRRKYCNQAWTGKRKMGYRPGTPK